MGKSQKEFTFKKVRVKCGLRGCANNQDVYSVSHSREGGHSILMCSEDILSIGAAFEDYLKNKPMETEKPTEEVPAFFSAGAPEVKEEDNSGNSDDGGTGSDNNGNEEFKCQYCGKVCASKLGLGSHERNCKENPANKS